MSDGESLCGNILTKSKLIDKHLTPPPLPPCKKCPPCCLLIDNVILSSNLTSDDEELCPYFVIFHFI